MSIIDRECVSMAAIPLLKAVQRSLGTSRDTVWVGYGAVISILKLEG
jgi:hypothetical protein